MHAAMAGPLKGIRIVELGGIGPAPFAAMMLADHGAEVIRVERSGMIGFENDPLRRSRRSISLDLKRPEACEVVRRLAANSDGLIEGYRPGVMERLGLGPDVLLKANPGLVYGRVTGWGQDGPLAQEAGHDINYIALTGLLHGIGPQERPVPPINYLGDYAGGGMMLAFGMVSALLAVKGGADGQVVDAAMSDGAALIGAMTYGLLAAGLWKDEREANLLDGGTATYGIYRCSDGKFLAIGAIEPQFQYALFKGLALNPGASREDIATVIKSRTRDAWVNLPDHGENRMDAAYALGGAGLLLRSVERLTRLRIDHLAIIDRTGVRRLTDSVGGVGLILAPLGAGDIDPAHGAIELEMSGEMALEYVSGHGTLAHGDLEHIRREHRYVRALLAQLRERGTLADPPALRDLAASLGGSVRVDESLTPTALRALLDSTKRMQPEDVTFLTAPVSRGGMVGVAPIEDAGCAQLWDAIARDEMAAFVDAHPELLSLEVGR